MVLLGCHKQPKPAAVAEPPLIPPPNGWRLVAHGNRPGSYGENFLPKERTIAERMWVTIIKRPEFLSKSIDELLQALRPPFICKSKDMNVLSKDANEIIFEEQDSLCYGRQYRYTMARITKAKSSISFYAYRADAAQLPEGRRDFVLKTLAGASLDKGPLQAQSVAANSGPSPAASPH